jgi:hypothetical protein
VTIRLSLDSHDSKQPIDGGSRLVASRKLTTVPGQLVINPVAVEKLTFRLKRPKFGG